MASNAPLLDDDDTPAFGEENEDQGKLKHPVVTLFHLLFRTAALLTYLLGSMLGLGFITCFIIVMLLLSADFWTVKNITGRLMVGLRWWNHVDDEGVSRWVYESRKSRVHPAEARVFWAALYTFPAIWAVLIVVAIFRFSFAWLVLPVLGVLLNGANVYGYLRCRYGANQGITASLGSTASDFMRGQVLKNITSMMFTKPAPSATSQPQQTI